MEKDDDVIATGLREMLPLIRNMIKLAIVVYLTYPELEGFELASKIELLFLNLLQQLSNNDDTILFLLLPKYLPDVAKDKTIRRNILRHLDNPQWLFDAPST